MSRYMLSELIKDGLDAYMKHGDIPVIIDVLTENQSNLFKPCGSVDVYNKQFYVTLDMGDLSISQFKKSIK